MTPPTDESFLINISIQQKLEWVDWSSLKTTLSAIESEALFCRSNYISIFSPFSSECRFG